MPLEIAQPRAALDDAAIDAFGRDGVICLSGLVDRDGVDLLRAAVARAMAAPSPHAQEFLPADGRGRYFSELHRWRRDPAYARIALKGALPCTAGRLFGPGPVRLLYDQMIVKEPGTRSPTPWHHDLPFWPADGSKILSIWIALDPVDPESGGVEYLRGSHRRPQRYRPTQPDTPATQRMRNMDLPPAPNASKDATADRITWIMEPGDAILFSALTLHGAGPNRRTDRPRRAVVIRYIGDDVRFVAGPHTLEFDENPGLMHGEPFAGPLFPLASAA